MAVVVQKVVKKVESDLEKAFKYYSVIIALNDIKMSRREIQLLSFAAVKGGITSSLLKEQFMEAFGIAPRFLYRIRKELVDKGWLVKVDKRYKVNPKVRLDFNKSVVLQINLIADEDR